jgi:hypothetical protein
VKGVILTGMSHIKYGRRYKKIELQVEVSAGDQDKIEGVWRCSISMINYALECKP